MLGIELTSFEGTINALTSEPSLQPLCGLVVVWIFQILRVSKVRSFTGIFIENALFALCNMNHFKVFVLFNHEDKISFHIFSNILYCFYYNKFLPLTKTSSSILNKNGNNGIPFSVPNSNRNNLCFSPFNIIPTIDLLDISLFTFQMLFHFSVSCP